MTICVTCGHRLPVKVCRLRVAATHQLICEVVYDVGVVQPPPVVLPPALDVDAGLPLEVWQVEVVPEAHNTFQLSDWPLARWCTCHMEDLKKQTLFWDYVLCNNSEGLVVWVKSSSSHYSVC